MSYFTSPFPLQLRVTVCHCGLLLLQETDVDSHWDASDAGPRSSQAAAGAREGQATLAARETTRKRTIERSSPNSNTARLLTACYSLTLTLTLSLTRSLTLSLTLSLTHTVSRLHLLAVSVTVVCIFASVSHLGASVSHLGVGLRCEITLRVRILS